MTSDRSVAAGVAIALSATPRSDLAKGAYSSNSTGNLLSLSPINSRSSGYVTAARLDALQEALSERDWAVTNDVARLRLVTGSQLERLHFADLTEASRPVVRRRVLGRLVKAQVLATLARRIGGVRAGSAGLVYYLDAAGWRLLSRDGTARRTSPPSERYVRHRLAVTEVSVSLAEAARTGTLRLVTFQAEPASWWPDGQGGALKPDAYMAVAAATHTDHWWVEVDLATEHGPALRRKLSTYVTFWQSGQLGPGNIMPRVLVTVPDTKRYSDTVRLIRQLPRESESLFVVALAEDVIDVIVRCLNESD